ncbi:OXIDOREDUCTASE 2OG-FE II OXYGENASE FAMILY PROTEIN [Salix purpurea]|uniref:OXIDOREDUCTASE 2OG-FE II OXYGENASE FAMILY PROTEIN n=1 Tax=Salix purpurea TaxID=77065 RepID=A0A9Q1A1P2_SALPP|nr:OXIDOREDUCTASE 2OG-FE II OXYGENASE FAMILY PROTEIN [Salix purpurea]
MEIPVIDLSRYLEIADQLGTEPVILSGQIEEFGSWLGELCKEVSQILRETGALVVKDPRCTAEDNDKFIDMMERYFERPREFKLLQERSHLHYQVGVTPEGVEVPRSLVDEEMQKKLKAMPKEFQPSTPSGPDPKWRYMWRVGPRPSNTRFKELNSEPVIPEGFPEWKDTMDSWGCKMISTIEAVAEMAAIGFRFVQVCIYFSYETGTSSACSNRESRFPGLNIWLRNGQKIEVKVPSGCLLIQTGKQIEWLTAGECMAGMHEVVVTNRTIDAIKLASQQNRSLWRVSSTLFAHIASDAVLKPLGHFVESPLASKYPPMCSGEFVEQELAVINLKGNKGES